MSKIILVGYMGSGKSTVARVLSRMTEIPAFDLDTLITQKAGEPISGIFAKYGELRFRKLENETLREFLDTHDDYILSTGGGTPCYYGNMELLKEKGETFFLRAGVLTLLAHLKDGIGQRPMLASLPDEERAEFIAKHLFERTPVYAAAKHTVSVDARPLEAIVEEILSKMSGN